MKEELEEKLELLIQNDYDVDLFEYKKNYIIGQAAIKKLNSLDLKWKGAYSKEDVSQHWLYYLIISLKSHKPKVYELILSMVDINEDLLENKGDRRVLVSSSKIESIITLILSSDIFTIDEKLTLGIALRKVINNLIAERNRKIREVILLIEEIKSSS